MYYFTNCTKDSKNYPHFLMEENNLLGQTYREGPNLNDNEWDLGNDLGLKFENHIFDILSNEMRKYYDLGVKTPKS